MTTEERARLDALLGEKRRLNRLDRDIHEAQLTVSEAERQDETDRQKLIDAEARTLRKTGLGAAVAFLRCFQCQAELPVMGLRQTVNMRDESAAWFALDSVCPACSAGVRCVYPANKKLCRVVTFALAKETPFSNYRDMKD